MKTYLGKLVFKDHNSVLKYDNGVSARTDFVEFIKFQNLYDVPFKVYFNPAGDSFLRCVFDNGLEFSDISYDNYVISVSSSMLKFNTNNSDFYRTFNIVNQDKSDFELDIPAKTLRSKDELVSFVNELLEHLK